MKVKRIRWLGLLGILGLLGVLTQNTGFYGFFGFFGFFRAGGMKSDELLEKNAGRAALAAYTFSVFALAFTIALISLRPQLETAAAGLAVTFFIQVLLFVTMLNYYERKGE